MKTFNAAAAQPAVHRTVALGLAFATTAFIAASVVTLFTGSTQQVGIALARMAVAPLRVLLGS